MKLCCCCSCQCHNWLLITAAVSRGPRHWWRVFGKSFVILWGFKGLGNRSAVESMGLALSLQALREFSGKQACGSGVKSWLCLNCLFLHFQGFAWLCGGELLFSEDINISRPECLPCCTAKMHALAFTACLCFSFRWTSLGSFGAGLSTVQFPAVIQSQWLQFHPSFSSYPLFFILVASFTLSRRNGYSFCVSDVVGVLLLELGGARDSLGSCGRGGPARTACSCADGLIGTISLLLSPEGG